MLAQDKLMLYWYQKAEAGAGFDNVIKGWLSTSGLWRRQGCAGCVMQLGGISENVTHFFPQSNMCLMVQPPLAQISSQGHSLSKCCLPEPQQWPARALFTIFSFMLKLIPVQQVRIRPRANASIALESHNEGLWGAQTGEYPVTKARVLSSSKFQNTASIRALPAFLSSAQHKTPCWNGHKPSAGLAESIDQQSCIWPWVWFGRKLGFACVIPLRIYRLQHH